MWNLIVMVKIYIVYNLFFDFGNVKSIKRNFIFLVKVKDKWLKIFKLYYEFLFQEKDECLLNYDFLYYIIKMKFYLQSLFILILRRCFFCY